MFQQAAGRETSAGAGGVGASADPAVAAAVAPASGEWTTEPGSGWSVADLEELIAVGVPVRHEVDPSLGPVAEVDAEGGWLNHLECPQLGPVSWLESLAPGGRLLAELEALPADLIGDDYDAVEVVGLWHALEAYCAGRKRLAAAALARRDALAGGLAGLDAWGVTPGQVNIAGDELAVRLGVSRRAANRLISSGRAMTGIGILTGDALLAGRLDAGKADTILDAVSDLGADAGLEVQERVLDKAALLGPGRLQRELATACATVDGEGFEERCVWAAQSRRLERPRVLPHGMASLYAVLPAAEAITLYRAVDAAARSGKAAGDPRTMDQLRADALAAMGVAATHTGWIGPAPSTPRHDSDLPDVPHAACREGSRGSADDPSVPGGPSCPSIRVGVIGGLSARIQVTVPFNTLMDGVGGRGQPPPLIGRSGVGAPVLEQPPPVLLDHGSPDVDDGTALAEDDGADRDGSELPDALAVAILDGYGPVPGSVARALAAGGPWARLVIDPIDRTVLEVSRETYEPPATMARLVRAGQPHCACPSCSVSSDGCDLNHRIPWPAGPTAVANLDPLCRRDHLLVTHAGWSYQDDADASGRPNRTWTTATGHGYLQRADGSLTAQPRPGLRGEPPSSPGGRPGPDDPPPF